MATEFDINTYTHAQGGILFSPEGAVTIPIVVFASARQLADASSYQIPAGTPLCLVSGQTYYMPIARDIQASEAYDSGTGLTTITTDNSAQQWAVGDTVQSRTGVGGSATTLGAITTIDTATEGFTVDTDVTGDTANDDIIDVTSRATIDGAVILLESIDVWDNAAQAVVNVATRALKMGAVVAATILGPQGSGDLQLIADLPQIELI